MTKKEKKLVQDLEALLDSILLWSQIIDLNASQNIIKEVLKAKHKLSDLKGPIVKVSKKLVDPKPGYTFTVESVDYSNKTTKKHKISKIKEKDERRQRAIEAFNSAGLGSHTDLPKETRTLEGLCIQTQKDLEEKTKAESKLFLCLVTNSSKRGLSEFS